MIITTTDIITITTPSSPSDIGIFTRLASRDKQTDRQTDTDAQTDEKKALNALFACWVALGSVLDRARKHGEATQTKAPEERPSEESQRW
jgi:hypothetical protein